jgi:hypothetical protein
MGDIALAMPPKEEHVVARQTIVVRHPRVWAVTLGSLSVPTGTEVDPGPLAPQARNINYLQASLAENKRLSTA